MLKVLFAAAIFACDVALNGSAFVPLEAAAVGAATEAAGALCGWYAGLLFGAL